VKPQRICCKIGKTIEQPCSDVLAHTPEVCKGTRLYNGYPAIKEDHDSWELCTTSTECKTVITAVLTVMSGMDPHMISRTWVGLVELGLVSLLCFATLGRMYDNKESTQAGTLKSSTYVWLTIYASVRWITKPKQDYHSCRYHNNLCKDTNHHSPIKPLHHVRE
jgi:hypothetical protein